MLDYIVVGQGLCGSLFAWELIKNNHSFVVIDANEPNTASKVAAGVYNPLVLKRFTPIWESEKNQTQLTSSFQEIGDFFGKSYRIPMPILRIIHNAKERQTWLKKAKESNLAKTMAKEIRPNQTKQIVADFGFGEVLGGGKIKINDFLLDIKNYLSKKNQYYRHRFQTNQIKILDNHIQYKDLKAKHLVFCEGIGAQKNEFTKKFPIVGNKGNVLHVRLQNTLEECIYKSKSFLMPLNQNLYYLGATYQREFSHNFPDEDAKNQLIHNLKQFYPNNFSIENHLAAVRPTVPDRKPIVGKIPKQKNLFVLNGTGSRGTMLAPRMAKILYNFTEHQENIPKEVNSQRFAHLF